MRKGMDIQPRMDSLKPLRETRQPSGVRCVVSKPWVRCNSAFQERPARSSDA
jgi:hypothetical protein